MIRHIALGTILLAAAAGPAGAEYPGDVAAGRRLAADWCSACHSLGPMPEPGSSARAPAFAAIAGRPSTTPLALRVFLQTPHDRMPNLKLTDDEIDDLSAYILSLRRR
jgi:mono/diheme cytochrome c family protein